MLKKILILFFFSGFSAVIYQIVWQRVLFTSFGINIEAVTIIVSIFMFGLGIGSLFGGYLSKKYNNKLLNLFIICEFSIGAFGIVSIPLIKYITKLTVLFEEWQIPFVVFAILVLPTMAMGATLPILIAYLFKISKSVGSSISQLYYINTLGSAVACLVVIWFIFVFFSLSTATYIAAGFNIGIGGLTFFYLKAQKNKLL